MPAGTRIRANNIMGVISDNPLTAGAITFNSVHLPLLSAISSEHAIVTFDPLRQYGAPEIAIITAHSTSAPSATITRGAYGTTARQHPEGTVWIHAPIDEDFTKIVTSGTRPADPFRGQMIFETDTNSLVIRDTSDSWQTISKFGAWTAWSAVVVQGNTPTQTRNRATYFKLGRLVIATFNISIGGAGTTTTAIRITGLPFAVASISNVSGTAHYFDSGNTNFLLMPAGDAANSVAFERDGFGNRFGVGDIIMASPDVFEGTIIYEATS